jgi:hypothetical protein
MAARGRFLSEHTIAVSLLDRLRQHANAVITDGESYRMREGPSGVRHHPQETLINPRGDSLRYPPAGGHNLPLTGRLIGQRTVPSGTVVVRPTDGADIVERDARSIWMDLANQSLPVAMRGVTISSRSASA